MEPGRLCIFISHPSDLLTDCQPHGDGLVAFGFIKHLAERGHQLHVVMDQFDICSKLPGNIEIYPVQIKTSLPFLRRILYLIQVREIFNQIQEKTPIDIIHQLNPVVPGLSFSLLGTSPPVVMGPMVAWWTPEAFLPRQSIGQKVAQFVKKIARDSITCLQQLQADALLIATPAALNKVHFKKHFAAKLHDLRHGIDANVFSPEAAQAPIDNTPQSSEKILFVGHISYRKGIFTLLEAFEIVASVLPSCRLILAGGWDEKADEVKAKIAKLPCRDQIEILGSVPREAMPDLIRSCTVYCMPSYGEPFGMGALESMACGKPIVGTDAGGLAYLISEQGGRKVPPRDAQALADALLEVLHSPELQDQMGRYNRELVETTYRWEVVIHQLEEVYYKLLNARSLEA